MTPITPNPYHDHPAIRRIRAMSPEERAATFPGAIPALQSLLAHAVDCRLAQMEADANANEALISGSRADFEAWAAQNNIRPATLTQGRK